MMKRPRSFIATLLILICVAASVGTLALPASTAYAGATTTRLMNPRAGDPDEPGDGVYPPPQGGASNAPSDPIDAVVPVPVLQTGSSGANLFGWDYVLSQLLGFLSNGWRFSL
jgi:hypothetical protein